MAQVPRGFFAFRFSVHIARGCAPRATLGGALGHARGTLGELSGELVSLRRCGLQHTVGSDAEMATSLTGKLLAPTADLSELDMARVRIAAPNAARSGVAAFAKPRRDRREISHHQRVRDPVCLLSLFPAAKLAAHSLEASPPPPNSGRTRAPISWTATILGSVERRLERRLARRAALISSSWFSMPTSRVEIRALPHGCVHCPSRPAATIVYSSSAAG